MDVSAEVLAQVLNTFCMRESEGEVFAKLMVEIARIQVRLNDIEETLDNSYEKD